MSDFLLELLSEEIPARMQEKACKDLQSLFEAEIAKAGLKAEGIATYAAPRRLALIAHGLPVETPAVSEEIKGPRADAPEQALAGFLGKTGLTREQLIEREVKGQRVLFAVIERPGRATADVLAEAIPAIVRAFPWPKSMRWGEASISMAALRWVRPLKGIVALLGDTVVPLEIDGIASGATTLGHRFHHPGPVTIGSAADYAAKLRACHVLVDAEERRTLIRKGAAKAAEAQGLALVPDEGLVAENAGLTEWPVPLLGAFDPAFLDVPREVIQLTMRTNQKYFACVDATSALAPAFVCTANIEATDGGSAIVAGNAKVLAARLADAKFFWEQDLKIPLEEQAKKLESIVFHEKLGTVADKVERVAKLARWLVEEGIIKGASADEAEQAARLCKADLVTGMVGEFPELQGVMGGYYAHAQGLPDTVADAIRDHYKPVGQGDEVPTAPITVAVSLADKLDTLVSLWTVGEKPTGSKDPFGLRRSALGIIALVTNSGLRLPIRKVVLPLLNGVLARQIVKAYYEYASTAVKEGRLKPEAVKAIDISNSDDTLIETVRLFWGIPDSENELNEILLFLTEPLASFFADRLKVQQREAGVRHDLIDAVFALGGEDDLVRLLARVHALQAFVATPDGANLLAGYKRAANILKKEGYASSPDPLPGGERAWEAEEAALHVALDAAEPRAREAVATEDFEGAMTALASLRGPIDAFFERVTVNDPDEAKRAARLALLARVRDAVHAVADFSKIEG